MKAGRCCSQWLSLNQKMLSLALLLTSLRTEGQQLLQLYQSIPCRWYNSMHTIHLYPAHWQSAALCYHLLSGRHREADSAEIRAILVGSLCQEQPNTQAERRLWFTDHNLYMERSVGFKGSFLLLVCCEGQTGLCDSSWRGCRWYFGDLKLWVWCVCYRAALSLHFAQGTHVTYRQCWHVDTCEQREIHILYSSAAGAEALRWCREGRGWITR